MQVSTLPNKCRHSHLFVTTSVKLVLPTSPKTFLYGVDWSVGYHGNVWQSLQQNKLG